MKSLTEREWFYSQEKEQIPLKSPAPYKIYRLKTTGQVVCEYILDIGLKQELEIALLGDLHLNLCTPEDMQDKESPYTYECRLWGRNGAHVPMAKDAMFAASFCDYTVVVGDILDFLSHGSMLLTKRYLTIPYPDVMMTIGWHDITKEMQTKRPNLLTDEERIAMLEEFWPHDIHYYKRELTDELVAICLGQKHTVYSSSVLEKLSEDIKAAEREGKKILIFQHEPFATGKEEDAQLECNLYKNAELRTLNLYDKDKLMCRPDDPCEENHKVKELITKNASVIKGIFVGHEHFQVYSELPAKMKCGDSVSDTVIPQHIVACNPDYKNGYYMRIIVK